MNEMDLGGIGGIGLVEEGPYFGFGLLPPGQVAVIVGLLEAELARQFLVWRFVRVQVQPVQHGQRLLRVTMLLNDDNKRSYSFGNKWKKRRISTWTQSTISSTKRSKWKLSDGKKGKKFRQEARNLSESSCSFFCCVESGNDGRDEAEHVE